MTQGYAVPPLGRRERPVWQAAAALSGCAGGPPHVAQIMTPLQLRWQRALVAWQAEGRLNSMARIVCTRPRAQRAAGRAQEDAESSAAIKALKSRCHTGNTGFFYYIFMNRWGKNVFVPRPPYWHGRIEIRQREMELEPWCDGLGELPSLS